MITTKTLLGILAVVAVVGVGVYFVSRSPSSSSAPVAVNEEKPAEGKKMAFAELVKQGGSYSCDVNQSVAGIDSKGTVYIGDGKIRAEFNTSVQGIKVDTSLIVRDGFTYTWSSLAPTTGFKVAVVESTSGTSGNAAASGSYSWNAEQIGDYDCVAWTPDQSKFTLPGNVTFKAVGSAQ